MLDTVVKAIQSNAKPATSSSKIFKDRASFDEVMNAQLKRLLTAPNLSSDNILQWHAYVAFLSRMIDEKGFDAADMYHRMLFVRISDGSHSLFSARGFYCDELVRDVDRTYADIAHPLGKGDQRFKSRYVHSHSNQQQQQSQSRSFASHGHNKQHSKSGGGGGKRFSSNKSLFCSHHGQCAHSTADCKVLSSGSASSSSSSTHKHKSA